MQSATVSLLSLFVLLVSHISPLHACWADFNDYPFCARSILCDQASTACDFGLETDALKLKDVNCLCRDRSWLTGVAQAIYAQCGCGDLVITANTAEEICSDVATVQLILTPDELITIGAGQGSACATNATNTPDVGNGLTEDNKIGLGVGIGIGVPALLVAVITLWFSVRHAIEARNQKKEQQKREKRGHVASRPGARPTNAAAVSSTSSGGGSQAPMLSNYATRQQPPAQQWQMQMQQPQMYMQPPQTQMLYQPAANMV